MDPLKNYREKYSNIFEQMNLPFDDYFFILKDYNCSTLITKKKESKIYQIVSKETGIIYAAEFTNQDISKFLQFEKTNILKSLYFMTKLNHPTILKLVGISPFDFKNKPKPVIVTEICLKSTLYDLLKIEDKKPNQNEEWNSTKKLINIFGIALGMKYIHSQNIIHRNLNPRSILLDDKYYPRIDNFEFCQDHSKSGNEDDKKIVGDFAYIAPEVFTQKGYSQATDVYSFGFLIYSIMTNKKPFKGINNINKIMIEVVNKNSRPKIIGTFPSCYKNLIKSCWQKDPNKRPSFEQIVEMLQSDPSFITDDISKDEYHEYVTKVYPQENKSDIEVDFDDKFHLEKEIMPSFSKKLIDINKVKKLNRIGFGHFATVFKVQDSSRRHFFAAKVMNLGMNKGSEIEIKNQLEKRYEKLSTLNFPSVLKMFGYSPYDFKNKINPTVFTELANITLKEAVDIERSGMPLIGWNLTKKLINIYGIAAGMKYLHSKNIIHRNLNMNSILIDDSFYPKISDFKHSKFLDEISGKEVDFDELNDDPMYIAHEIWSKSEEYKSSDVYSFSLIVYEILTKESPTNMPRFNIRVPDCYMKLILTCYDEDQNQRPTFDEIVDILKKDQSFIAEGIDVQEYNKYVELIDNYLYPNDQANQDEQNDQDIQASIQMDQFVSHRQNTSSYLKIDPKFIVDINDYKRMNEIGKGSFGKVFTAQNIKTQEVVAAKVLIMDEDDDEEKNIQLFRELRILAQINYPSLLRFIGYSPVDFNFNSYPTIFTELCQGTLRNIIELEQKGLSPPGWDDTNKLITIFGIANGMKYLHSLNIIHRDLKPENILENEYFFPKICDFGLSKKFHQNPESMSIVSNKGIKGTPVYIAPEIFDEKEYSKASDVYAFAFLVYEIITTQKLYPNCNFYEVISKVTQGSRPEMDSMVPNCYRELIEKCWSQNMDDRPTFDEIVETLQGDEFLTDTIDIDKFLNYCDYLQFINHDNKDETFNKATLDLTKLDKKEKKNLFSLPNLVEYDLTILEKKIKLGSGAFAKVYKVYNKINNEVYAAKILKKEICDLEKNEQINLSREIKIISSINYESIIKFIGYSSSNFKKKPRPVIITELAQNGSLRDILNLERKGCAVNEWDETKKFINIYGIAVGMKYLHSQDILHRDLKPENILLDEYLFPKITDFGLSKINSLKSAPHDYHSEYLGTPPYMAPEIWRDTKYIKANDVYAFAMILYELLTNEVPLNEFHDQNIIIYQVGILKYRPKFKIPIPKCYKELIESCWSEDPDMRPSFEEIVDLLKTDTDFITDNVDLDDFIYYSELINEEYTTLKPSEPKQKVIKKVEVQNSMEKINEITINNFSRIIETEISNHSINNYTLNLNEYEQKGLIRKNEFSKIFKVVQKSTNNEYAAKISNIDMNQFSNEEMFNIAIELNSISLLNHPSIIKFVGFSPCSFKKESKPVVITEIFPERTLNEILNMERKNFTFPGWNSTKKLIIIYGIASAMKYLHDNNIIHRSLSPNNVLLDKSLYPKLYDFGLCTHLLIANSMTLQTTSKAQGSPIYSAPEILNSREHTKESDVYSFGMIVYEMMSREKPLNSLDYSKFISDVVNKNKRPKFNNYIPDCYRNLIENCWSMEATERFSFEEILDYIKNEPQFITADIDKDEFMEYIAMLS